MLSMELLKNIVFSGFASLFFALYFNMHTRRLILSFISGALTYTIQQYVNIALSFNVNTIEFISSTVASMGAALLANWLAHNKQMPKTIFIFTAIIPLIPGGLLFDSINELFEHGLDSAKSYMVRTFCCASGIGMGIVLITSFNRLFSKITTLIDGTNRKKLRISENHELLKSYLDSAEKYYHIAKACERNDTFCAKGFYEVALEKYNNAINFAEKAENPNITRIYQLAGVTSYRIYKILEENDIPYGNRDYLGESEKDYIKAINSIDEVIISRQYLSKLYNWRAVLKICEARKANKTNGMKILDEAEDLLLKARSQNSLNPLVDINTAEICLLRIKFILGLSYQEPLSLYKTRKRPNLKQISNMVNLLEKAKNSLTEALVIDFSIENLYYKMAQVYTYMTIVHKLKNESDKITRDLENAEYWIVLAYSISPNCNGILYIHREYYEAMDNNKKAEKINDIIQMKFPSNAMRWKKLTQKSA